MEGCKKERGWGGLSRATLNELNLVLQAGRFYQMQSNIYRYIDTLLGSCLVEHSIWSVPLSLARMRSSLVY